MNLVKSKRRVADHGEVFTPAWLVEAMLDLVKDESERIDSRFLEPACGSGNFLVQILRRKLAAVELKYGKSDFERRHYALLGLMCMYGIELLADNIAECRANVLEVLADNLNLDGADELYRAASYVLSQNLVHGDDFGDPVSTNIVHPPEVWRNVGCAGRRGHNRLPRIVDGGEQGRCSSRRQSRTGRGPCSGGDELDYNLAT